MRDAKINKKADKQAADNEMKMNLQSQAGAQTDGGEVEALMAGGAAGSVVSPRRRTRLDLDETVKEESHEQHSIY